MTRRAPIFVTVVLMVAIGAGCGSTAHRATPAVQVVNPAVATGPLQLAAFDDGVGAFGAGLTAPVWREPGAVAALDGSAVFSIRAGDGADNLVRLDPSTGAVTSTWALSTDGLSISAVAPAGKWVALTDRMPGYGSQGRSSTELLIFDATTGAVTHRTTLTGDIQPEAFSVDGRDVFVLHYIADHYRVQTLELTGTSYRLYDTTDRDKTQPAEDMHGRPLHGVLSADRTLLATLYRNPGDAKEPAFVHVLDLAHTWSYCADLPAPFGTGAAGSDAIELTAAGTVVVAANEAQRLAEIHIDAVSTPGDSPVPVAYRTGTIAPPPASLTSIPGFEYVIAPLSG
jgi:hypothetical protein